MAVSLFIADRDMNAIKVLYVLVSCLFLEIEIISGAVCLQSQRVKLEEQHVFSTHPWTV